MHPADVLDFVTDEVAELERRLESRSDLGVLALQQEDVVVDLEVDIVRYATATATASSGLLAGRGAIPVRTHFGQVPVIGSSAPDRLVLRTECSNFDATPPAVDLLDADGELLPEHRWPRGILAPGGIAARRQGDGRPFICRRGLRAYHEHPQHADDPWDLHREGMRLADIVIGVLDDLKTRWVSPR